MTSLKNRQGWANVGIITAILIGLALSAVGTWQAEQAARKTDQHHFAFLTERIRDEITLRLQQCENGLRGARSLWPASKSVERGEFTAMIAERNLTNEFPGALGVGFIRRVARSELPAFLAATRGDDAPDFQLKNLGTAPELDVVEFIHPLERNRAAEGLDFAQTQLRSPEKSSSRHPTFSRR
jgi:CHASE1-domain containing sensor protein